MDCACGQKTGKRSKGVCACPEGRQYATPLRCPYGPCSSASLAAGLPPARRVPSRDVRCTRLVRPTRHGGVLVHRIRAHSEGQRPRWPRRNRPITPWEAAMHAAAPFRALKNENGVDTKRGGPPSQKRQSTPPLSVSPIVTFS